MVDELTYQCVVLNGANVLYSTEHSLPLAEFNTNKMCTSLIEW